MGCAATLRRRRRAPRGAPTCTTARRWRPLAGLTRAFGDETSAEEAPDAARPRPRPAPAGRARRDRRRPHGDGARPRRRADSSSTTSPRSAAGGTTSWSSPGSTATASPSRPAADAFLGGLRSALGDDLPPRAPGRARAGCASSTRSTRRGWGSASCGGWWTTPGGRSRHPRTGSRPAGWRAARPDDLDRRTGARGEVPEAGGARPHRARGPARRWRSRAGAHAGVLDAAAARRTPGRRRPRRRLPLPHPLPGDGDRGLPLVPLRLVPQQGPRDRRHRGPPRRRLRGQLRARPDGADVQGDAGTPARAPAVPRRWPRTGRSSTGRSATLGIELRPPGAGPAWTRWWSACAGTWRRCSAGRRRSARGSCRPSSSERIEDDAILEPSRRASPCRGSSTGSTCRPRAST